MYNENRSNKITVTEGYTPNFSDPRVRERFKIALGFTLLKVYKKKPKSLSQSRIEEYFGISSNNLSGYLRCKLLKTVDDSYGFTSLPLTAEEKAVAIANKKIWCKKYIQNIEGIDEMLRKFNFTYEDFGKRTPKEKNQLIDLNILKKEIVLSAARKEFGDRLACCDFTYTLKSDRYWGATQYLKKDIKQQLHYEYGYLYEYDIEACAPTLLLQYAISHGLSNTKSIDDFIKNKNAVRLMLSNDLGIDIKIIKQSLNALFAGARVDKSIAKLIINPDKVKAFRNHPTVDQLIKDISKLWRVLKETLDETDKKGRINAKKKWALYFSLERAVLDVVREKLIATKNNHLIEHDGWTTQNPLDLNEIINLISEKTGFDVNISFTVLKNTHLIPCI